MGRARPSEPHPHPGTPLEEEGCFGWWIGEMGCGRQSALAN
jgi:hypothetical protein